MVGKQPWIDVPVSRPAARLRVYCLPYAGGGAAVYKSWPDKLDERIEVRSLLLPGRERHLVEPALPSVEALADLIVPALVADLDGRPFAIFGHSLGALLGFEVAIRLVKTAWLPVHLLASGARAPHLPDRGGHHRMPDAEFLRAVGDLGGTPPELASHQEFLELMLPTLRLDFTAAETYHRCPSQPLPCPITVFGGADDPLCSRRELDEWSVHTISSFHVHLLPGDHFFVTTARTALLDLVTTTLAHAVDT